jgi:apolipoprotein D and lipocalin family protein
MIRSFGGFDPKITPVRISGTPPLAPVDGFDLIRYSGTWHEIARIDHPFERGLSRVTAEYSIRQDGRVTVLNRGYDAASGEWRERKGLAAPCDDAKVGSFFITFYPPYTAVYNVIALDEVGYQWAMVSTDKTDRLWILSRQPQLDPAVTEGLLDLAGKMGFDVRRLLWTSQEA